MKTAPPPTKFRRGRCLAEGLGLIALAITISGSSMVIHTTQDARAASVCIGIMVASVGGMVFLFRDLWRNLSGVLKG